MAKTAKESQKILNLKRKKNEGKIHFNFINRELLNLEKIISHTKIGKIKKFRATLL